MNKDSPARPPTVQEVIFRSGSEWDALQAALSTLDATKMTMPGEEGWSVKDELAHLAAWARGLAALVRKQPRYPPMGLPADAAPHTFGIESMNQMIFERNRTRTLKEVQTELLAAHQDAIAAISELSDEELLRPYDDFQPQDRRPDGDTPILWRIAGNTFGHCAEHRETIMRMWSQE
jgi:uncharacterized protein (TIGR03083 family)